jgi:radical SAM-linked protein
MLAVIRFRTGGSVRFLSHAETLRVFQRACVRAGLQIAYSQGFNPHQKMSLVPPRSVGVESDDDMLCLRLAEGQTGIDAEALKAALPEGIKIISVETTQANNIPEPISAKYMLKVQNQKIDDGIRKHITDILAGDKFVVNRRAGEDSRTKPVDVRPFVESIEVEGEQVTVDCKISQAGTIRVNEILDLLHLKTADLTGPVRRVSVRYL